MPGSLDAILAQFAGLPKLVAGLPPQTQRELAELLDQAPAKARWLPNGGPQQRALYSEADELLFGGEAGGGKSDLLIGVALEHHQRARILRRINMDVADLGERLLEIVGEPKGYNAQSHVWRGHGGQFIELKGCEQEKDKQRFKGKARDFIGYDELADFLESQYVFINTWNRSTIPGQRCRVIGATNGPTTIDGQWIVRRWGAWLDPNHPDPAEEGELRWYLELAGGDVEVDGPGPHAVEGRREPVRALSRSFIRSHLENNPDLAATDYGSRLEALPEELRKVYRDGDFTTGLRDDEYQVIPSTWIEAAMARWTAEPPRGVAMTAMGVDIAEGGPDQTVLAFRHGGWFAPLAVEAGVNTKDGRVVASLVVRHRRNNCPVIIDVGGGYGANAVIACKDNRIEVVAYKGQDDSKEKTLGSKLDFRNKRACDHWRLREALDPEQDGGSVVALPNDPLLKADLAAVRYKRTPRGDLLLYDKAEIKDKLGRSPDRGDAVVMCWSEGQRALRRAFAHSSGATEVQLGYSNFKRRR